jgi:hypothetical protein
MRFGTTYAEAGKKRAPIFHDVYEQVSYIMHNGFNIFIISTDVVFNRSTWLHIMFLCMFDRMELCFLYFLLYVE